MTVIVYREYEVDTDHLDPSKIRIKDFAEMAVYRMLEEEFISASCCLVILM